MTKKRMPPLGPTSRRFSPKAAEPIGSFTSKAGAIRTGMAIVSLAHSVGPLLVMTDPSDKLGRVYAVPKGSERARIFSAKQPSWIVGTFNRDAAAVDIGDAILATREQSEDETA